MPQATANPTNAARPTWRFPALCGLGIAVVVLGALAPQLLPSATPATSSPTAPDLTPLVVRFAGTTAVVLVLCAATAWLCGRRFRPQATTPGGAIEVLEAMTVGGRCRVHLVRIGDQLLLAGVDAAGLKSLIHLPGDAEALEEPATRVLAARTTLGPSRLSA